jgi:hypothetical protein
MDRIYNRDKQLEGTAKPTGNAGKASPRPWEIEQYIYKEEPREEKWSLHSDPRLELARHQHQESDFTPSDDDDGYGYHGFDSGFTPHLDASDSTASDLGTLAGGGILSKKKKKEDQKIIWVKRPSIRPTKVSRARQDPPRKQPKLERQDGGSERTGYRSTFRVERHYR